MKRAGFAGKPLAIGLGAVLTGGLETAVESTAAEVMPSSDAGYLDVGGAAPQTAKPGDWGGIELTLTPLQRMIQDILDPLALETRAVREWRNLYRSFFSFFAPNGAADETERRAWAIAAEVFNTNLVAVANRTTQVVPMTFQDFLDGVDSFRHDGLREGAHRDIAWQPKKTLLLMAAMIGRVVAGWQADAGLAPDPPRDLFPFRNHLIEENRKASFLGSVFGYDPRFSILEYGAAGLKPLLQAFPHFAHALMENGICRCEFCAPQVAGNPPLLRAHFLRPLRASPPLGSISALDMVLLAGPPASTGGSHDSETPSAYFESSSGALQALAFEPSEAPEIRCSKTERLFELALTGGLLLCGPQRAEASNASRLARTLGRTPAEQFVIERFFALGFRNGRGNEPWLEQAANQAAPHDANSVKKARKQFGHWKDACWFFFEAGQPQAAEVPGARIRQEALQPKGSDLFRSLLNHPLYAPLMGVLLAVDGQGTWVVDEPELHGFARNLNGGAGRVLLESGAALARSADSFHDPEAKGVFLFECALGILVSATGGHRNPRHRATLERAEEALRSHYERAFAVSLSAAPSGLRAKPAQAAAELAEAKKRSEEAERTIVGLLGEPLNRKVAEQLPGALAALPEPGATLVERPLPAIRLENRAVFEESLTSLCGWINSSTNRAASAASRCASQWLGALVALRVLAEEGNAAEALEKASAIYPLLNGAKRQALAPFFAELSWLFLRAIERELAQGDTAKATALAARAMAIIEGTPSPDDFRSLLHELFAPRALNPALATPSPLAAAPAAEAPGPRTRQAEVLLREFADELGLAENQLEQAFLEAVRQGSDAAFKRREKLRNRLQRRTRWGGREPYKTTLKLLDGGTAAGAEESVAGTSGE